MSLSTLIGLRKVLNARRQTQFSFILIAFGGPLVTWGGFMVHGAVHDYAARGWPLYPLLLGTVLLWLGIGIPAQTQLNRDRQWSRFLSHMAVGPAERLAVHATQSILSVIVFAIWIPCGLAGGGIELWTPAAAMRWPVMAAGIVWVISVRIAWCQVMSRCLWAARVLVACLMLWGLALTGRMAWAVLAAGKDPMSFSDICSNDWLLMACGIEILVRVLTTSDDTVLRVGLIALVQLAFISAGCLILSFQLVSRPALDSSTRRLAVAMTRPLQRILARHVPGARGGVICIEWLRVLRGTHTKLSLMTLASLAAVVGMRVTNQDGNIAILALPLVATLMVSDCVPDILRNQQGGRLYCTYGVSATDYLYGFISAVATIVAALCIAHLPVLSLNKINGQLIRTVFCTCIAIPFVLIRISVAIDFYTRRICSSDNMRGALMNVMRMGLIQLPYISFAFLLFLVGMRVSNLILLLITGFLFIREVRRTRLPIVKAQYWGPQHDPTGPSW